MTDGLALKTVRLTAMFLFKAYNGMASNQAKGFFWGGACALDTGALVVSGRVGLLR